MDLGERKGVPVFLGRRVIGRRGVSVGGNSRVRVRRFVVAFFGRGLRIRTSTRYFRAALLPRQRRRRCFRNFPFCGHSPEIMCREGRRGIRVGTPPEGGRVSENDLTRLVVPPLYVVTLAVTVNIFVGQKPCVCVATKVATVALVFSVREYMDRGQGVGRRGGSQRVVCSSCLLHGQGRVGGLERRRERTVSCRAPALPVLRSVMLRCDDHVCRHSVLSSSFLGMGLKCQGNRSRVAISCRSGRLSVAGSRLVSQTGGVPGRFRGMKRVPMRVSLGGTRLNLMKGGEGVRRRLGCLLTRLAFFRDCERLRVIFVRDKTCARSFRCVQ